MSNIEWTDKTWNPFAGCSRTSAGCLNCYAEIMAGRMATMKNNKPVFAKYEGIAQQTEGGDMRFTGKTRFYEDALDTPLKFKKPRKIFVNSMSDTFYKGFTFEQVDKVMGVIRRCPQHTFQVLTKRADRMYEYFTTHFQGDLPQNIHLGITAENQKMADARIPFLLEIPVSVRFLSIEPMLEAVDISAYLPHLQWVIVGGESGVGDGIRPMRPEWARAIQKQCAAYDKAFFFKQIGRFLAKEQASPEQAEALARRLKTIDGYEYYDCAKVTGGGGDLLDGELLQAFPKPIIALPAQSKTGGYVLSGEPVKPNFLSVKTFS